MRFAEIASVVLTAFVALTYSAVAQSLSDNDARQWSKCIGILDAWALYRIDAGDIDGVEWLQVHRESEIALLNSIASRETAELTELRLRRFLAAYAQWDRFEDGWLATPLGEELLECGRLTDRLTKSGVKPIPGMR